MATLIFAAMFFLVACGSSAGPSPAPSTSQPPAPPPSISSISPTSGPTSGGTTVTINGANFQKGATVTFGGAAATSDSLASSTKLTATSPKGNVGTAAVVVTNTDGQTGTLAAGFTYTDTGSGGGGGLSGSPGATATQYVLTYTASTNKMCTIEVSQNQSFAPLVHAVDPSIFPGSDSDGQTNIGQRTFVVGERTIAAETDTAPSIVVGAGNATRAPLKLSGYTTGVVTVAYAGQPFVAGDNITVTGMSDSSFDSTWARVMSASANSFTYWTLATAAGTSGGGTVARSNHYSLALENNTTYYYRIGGASNTCGASPATGTFTTMDWPNGDTFAETWPTQLVMPTDGSPHYRQYILPTVFETHDVAKNGIIDPMTGTLVRPLTLYSDSNWAGMAPAENGFQRHCTMQQDSNGLFHCWVQRNGGGGVSLYGINPTTGGTTFLGLISGPTVSACKVPAAVSQVFNSTWDENDPDSLYGICKDEYDPPYYHYLFKWTYTGNDVAAASGASASAAVTLVNSTPLETLMSSFDPNFNATEFHNFSIAGVDSNNVAAIADWRWAQDSPAWLIAYDLNANQIIGATTSWGNQIAANCSGSLPTPCSGGNPNRWTGAHGITPFYNNTGWLTFAPGHLHTVSGVMGDFDMILNQTGGVNGTDSTTPITVTSTPVSPCPTGDTCGSPGDPMSVEVPPDGSTFLDQAEPGDYFQFCDGAGDTNCNEIVQITARASSTSLTIARGCHFNLNESTGTLAKLCDGTNESAHADGATLVAYPYQVDTSGITEWDFAADPHGTDTTDTTVIHDNYGIFGHWGGVNPCVASEAWGIKCGSPWDSTFFHELTQYYVNGPEGVSFAGVSLPCGAASCKSYPSDNPSSPSSVNWFWDTAAYMKSNYADTASQLAGTTYIYKYTFGKGSTFTPALPYFSTDGTIPLRDISAPGATLTDTAADNYEFCIAHQAGDCWSGSSPGDIYANLGNAAVLGASTSCAGNETNGATADWCVDNTKGSYNGVLQISFLRANQIGTNQYNGKPYYGWGKSRKLVEGLWTTPRTWQTSGMQELPDQSWVYYDNCMANPYSMDIYTSASAQTCDTQIYLAKVPPQPPDDGIDRTNFEPVPITIGAGPSGATQAIIKYGYQENGPITSFYCTQYQATCYWTGSALSPAFAASNAVTSPLNSTVNLAIGIPQRVIFYQVVYLDSSNKVVGQDPVTADAVP